MKKLLLIATLVCASTWGAIVQESIFIYDQNKRYIPLLEREKELVIDHLSADGYELYGPEGTMKWLKQVGVPHVAMVTVSEKANDYPTSANINKQIRKIVNSNPSIFKLIKIGQSERGQDLLVVKVSDNVTNDELEPEVKLVANMHGDEIMGREILLQFLEDIARNYNYDSDITNIVNNTELYIMPSLNPDGADSKRRGNAKWVDLNRSFPDFTTNRDIKNPPSEVKAMMDFQKKRNFSLSFNYHGGSVVVNYPWDTTHELHEENDLIVELSKLYSYNTGYFLSDSSFTDGIVNGYQWYEVNGGMQDWSYHWHNDLQVTIEVSDRKWPSYSRRNYFFQENRDAIIKYIQASQKGFGLKLEEDGVIQIQKFENGSYRNIGEFATRNKEFHKVLSTGTYKLIFEGPTSHKEKFITVNESNTAPLKFTKL